MTPNQRLGKNNLVDKAIAEKNPITRLWNF